MIIKVFRYGTGHGTESGLCKSNPALWGLSERSEGPFPYFIAVSTFLVTFAKDLPYDEIMKSFLGLLFSVGLLLASEALAEEKWKNLTLTDFKYSELGHTRVSDLSSLKGRWILVDIWASWCSPCRDSFPFYNKLYQEYKDQGLAVVAISMDDEEKDVINFLSKTKVNFPVYFDRDQVLRKKLDPSSLPIHYWIGPDGKVVEFKRGFRPVDEKKIEKQANHFLTKYKGE